jgi:hypothetical protein
LVTFASDAESTPDSPRPSRAATTTVLLLALLVADELGVTETCT